MTIRLRAAGVAAFLAFAVCLFAGSPARAETTRWTDTVVIDTDDNLVLAGGHVSPGKAVGANFVGAGGRVLVDQPVGENSVVAGGSVEVRAPIGENLRAAGGTVVVAAPVGGNLSAAGADVRIAPEGTIGQGARLYGSSIVVDGRIGGDLLATGDKVVINGEVRGDVRVMADHVELGPKAKIGGRINYVSAGEIKQAAGASVGGAVTRMDEATAVREWHTKATHSAAASVVGTILSFALLLGCGSLFLAVAPIFSVEAPERVTVHPLMSLGVGLLTLIAAPIVGILFLITIIGIPVTLILIALYPFTLLLGFLVGTLWVASFVPRVLRWAPPPTVRAAIGHFAIALAAVLVLTKVPVLGGWVLSFLFIAGVGAFEVELYRRLRSGSRAMAGHVEVVRP